MIDNRLLWMRFILAFFVLTLVGAAGGFVLIYAKDLDKLTLTLAMAVLMPLVGELKTAFAWFFDGVAKVMSTLDPAKPADPVVPPVKE